MGAPVEPHDAILPIGRRDLYTELAPAWVRNQGTLPPSPAELGAWAGRSPDIAIEAEVAYPERRGPDPWESARVEPGSATRRKITLTNGYFAAARRHAPKGSDTSRNLAARLSALQQEPPLVDQTDVERLRWHPVPIPGTSPPLALWVEPGSDEVVVLYVAAFQP